MTVGDVYIKLYKYYLFYKSLDKLMCSGVPAIKKKKKPSPKYSLTPGLFFILCWVSWNLEVQLKDFVEHGEKKIHTQKNNVKRMYAWLKCYAMLDFKNNSEN